MRCGLGVVLDVIPSFTKMNSPFFSLLFPQLDLYDLGDGKLLKVNVSEPKTRLFIGNIPKSKGKEEIEEEFNKLSGNCHRLHPPLKETKSRLCSFILPLLLQRELFFRFTLPLWAR